MLKYGQMEAAVYDSAAVLGQAAADALATILREAIAERGEAAIMLATGNSQLAFMAALCERSDIDWRATSIFHLDEYVGISARHPASFRRYLHDRLVDVVQPRAFYGLEGDAANLTAEMERYASLLREHDPVACVLGVGENGHLAFNDPPADFRTERLLQVTTLADASRRQQVNEGHFSRIEEVPTEAITLTVLALLRARHVLAIVPEARKAEAIKAALEGPVTPDLPASILRAVPHVRLYLDRDSASLLTLH